MCPIKADLNCQRGWLSTYWSQFKYFLVYFIFTIPLEELSKHSKLKYWGRILARLVFLLIFQ